MRSILTTRHALTGAVLCCLSLPAQANKANDTLVYASDSEPENVSPYHNNLREGVILSHLAWDTLIYRNPETNDYEPMLATEWHWVDDTTLEMTLREGVTFQNGEPFNADDVVFTFNYVVSPESKVVTRQNIDWIDHVEKIDDTHVRFHLDGPFPAALEYLSGPLPVYPDEYFQEVGLETYSQQPIGTGPYRITEVIPGEGVTLERNDDYFADSPIGKPQIGKLEFKVIPDQDSRVAQLMTGQVDWIWRVPADQAEQMQSVPNITVDSGETMRVGYIALDAAEREDSPLHDLKVRRAINHAINRQGMADNLVRGGSRPLYAPCFPAQFGCETEDVVDYDYDPEKARTLLEEAGYGDGFEVDLFAYRERDYAEAMIGDLRNVGIRANLRFMTSPALLDMQRGGKTDMSFKTWGSYSVNDVSAITSVYFGGGADDRWNDEQVQQWLQTADTSVDPAVRKENYRKALQRISEQAYWAPLFSYSTYYAYTADLNFTPYPDELPRFAEASWQ
ncbi:ABC transporter substrate-binding protein [Salinicola avicenniae]|uniref:ABC transporter substrate-binding protein n=1 Tax=Salinicola avicenniae TaxID=2916836 RepID=UPI0020736567|nr:MULTISPECIES: ABC transporter substrate-binding protein [unclassified Salinicola]